jgi:plasmid stability protein
MAQVIVRNLDDGAVVSLKRRAALKGRSLEQELREIIVEASGPGPQDLVALADRVRGMTPAVAQFDSTDLIREDRDR